MSTATVNPLESSSSSSSSPSMLSSFNPFKWFSKSDAPLLPAPILDSLGREPRTVVFGLEDNLMHLDWSRYEGWKDHVRSDAQNVLEKSVKNGWEIVLFSGKPQMELQEHVQGQHAKLDPYGFIKHKLWQEHTNTQGFGSCKNLERLNRDLNRVVVVDWNVHGYCNHHDNVIVIDKFDDTAKINDKKLTEISTLLKKMQDYNVHDVRPYIIAYNQNPKANIFEREEKLAEGARNEWQSIGGGAPIQTTTSSTNKSWSLAGLLTNLGLIKKAPPTEIPKKPAVSLTDPDDM